MTSASKVSAEKKEDSPGLAFLLAAHKAMPRTITDRSRIDGISESFAIALRCRFRFHKDDKEALKSLEIRTCVGVFRPFDENFYSLACVSGSSFVKTWEVATGIDPWVANKAFGISNRTPGANILAGCRVAPGMGVLILCNPSDDMENLARTADAQVWWCTSFTNEKITLARYEFPEDSRYPFRRQGSPAKIMSMNRQQWSELQKRQSDLDLIHSLASGSQPKVRM